MFSSQYDPIGFNPTQNQSEYGSPQTSPYGLELRATHPLAKLDYYPTDPYRLFRNYGGNQVYGFIPADMYYALLFGYRGIMPIEELPLINKPLPYQR